MNIFWFHFLFSYSLIKPLNKLKGRVEPSWVLQIFDPSDWCTYICKTIFAFFKPQFHHEDGLIQHRYFELFSRHGQYFHPTKDQPRTRPSSTFLYICCNFGQIFCTNVIQFFYVENIGHNQLKKWSKYHLVSLLNEKQRSTFANFLHLFFIHVPS